MHGHPDMKPLRTAIPYIRAYEGRVFVIKLSGRLCDPGPALDHVAEQIALLSTVGIKLVVVHGGGDQLTAAGKRMGLEAKIVGGRRVTDEGTLELAKMTFAGTINTNIVAALRKCDVPAVGLTGADGGTITVVKRPVQKITDPESGQAREIDFGYVGDISATRMELLETLLAKRFVPVMASLAADARGVVYNVNADTIAARIAVDLSAVKYILLTSVDGILLRQGDPKSLQSYLDEVQLDELVKNGVVTGGMLPKAAACAAALKGGVPRVHIINGLVGDNVLAEVFTNEGCGTLVVAKREAASGPE